MIALVEGGLVDVLLEFVKHAAVVGTDGDETANVVLFVETVIGFCKSGGCQSDDAQNRNFQKRGYLCLHRKIPKLKQASACLDVSEHIKYIMFGNFAEKKIINR